MVKYFLRHYETIADNIIIFDEQSTDGTRELIKACPKADLREWEYKGLDDEAFVKAINFRYRIAAGAADWVMWVDVDELVYHPDIVSILDTATEDMIGSKGYALISPDGWPVDDGRQLYEQVTTGLPQPNYDKYCCWRPTVDVVHTIGRHTYPGRFPRCSGVIGTTPRFKLFHCHHIGGVEHTKMINQRNLDRCTIKRYAWNYTPEHDKPTQVGTVSWVRDVIENKKLVNVWT